jgi:hypothetical protein
MYQLRPAAGWRSVLIWREGIQTLFWRSRRLVVDIRLPRRRARTDLIDAGGHPVRPGPRRLYLVIEAGPGLQHCVPELAIHWTGTFHGLRVPGLGQLVRRPVELREHAA